MRRKDRLDDLLTVPLFGLPPPSERAPQPPRVSMPPPPPRVFPPPPPKSPSLRRRPR